MVWIIIALGLIWGVARMIKEVRDIVSESNEETEREISKIERAAQRNERAELMSQDLRQLRAEKISREVDERARTARRERLARDAPQPADKNPRVDDWLPRNEWIASVDDPCIPDFGTWARFEYVDADGVVTQRSIRQWAKHGAYIEGFCMDRREGRTFRQDRISNFRSG